MSDQPFKSNNPRHQHFQCRPAAAQIHRLEFSITSTSRNIHDRGHNDTNNSDRNSKSRTNSNNNSKVTRYIQNERNNRNLGQRAGAAFSFQPITNTASSAGRTMISHPRATATAPTLAPPASSIEISSSSSRPPPLPPLSTSTKSPGTAPPEHRPAKAVEQTQTPPKPLTARLPEEQTMHLKNTIAAPKISVPAFSAPSAPILALHHQHSPPRISSDLSSDCSPPAAHCSSAPALLPKPKGVKPTFASQLTESVGHRPQELASKEGISERSLQSASDHDLDAITNITHTTMLKQEEDPSSTSQATKLSSSSLVVFPPIAGIADMPSDRCREDLSSSSSRAVLTHAPQREFADLPDISAMLVDRTMMKQQWMESEQLLFSLVGELRMRVKEESERHHNAQQKVQVTSESNTTLQAQNSRLQTDIAVMDARIADFQSRIQELDADRIRLAEVYEASRSQMATQLASVRQSSMEASFVLEGLATAKSRWEAEFATLRVDMQAMESERGLLRTSYDHLTESFSVCSVQLKDIQTAYNKVKGICESRQEEVNQYRTRCQSLSDQLCYLSEKVEELNRENDELRVASEALQVTNHTMSDRIEFLKQANEYHQSILSAQLRDVEIRCCESNADELSKIKHELAGAKEVVKDVAVLESRVREGTLKAEDLTTRNAELDTELGALKESTARHQEIITQLQETKRRLESENQRLMQSSMSAQADYVIELNATVERCEELRQRQATESQTVIDDKDEQIGELTKNLETNTREFQKLTGEKQQLSELVDYQAQTAAATDREMLELRVKIQLLQSDHDFVTKARNDLRDELDALQQAHEAQQQQSVMPMPLTDIARLHSRDREGGGGAGSASVTDFLQWPVDLGALPSATSSSRTDTGAAAVPQGLESPSFVSLPACSARAPSALTTARSNTKTTTNAAASATTLTSAVGTPVNRSRGVTTLSSSSTTLATAAAVVLTIRTRSSNNPAATAATSAGRGEKRSLKRKRNVNESDCRAGGGGGGGTEDSETSGQQEGDLEAAVSGSSASPSTNKSTSAGGVGIGVGAGTGKAKRSYSKRLAQQQQQQSLQIGSSSSSTSVTAAATKKPSRRK